jgi:anti-sigma28 factor (negative regulator of flagellin synthesis)
MNIDVNKIISVKDIATHDRMMLESRLEKGCLFIFDDNKPKYVLMTMEEYSNLTEKDSNITSTKSRVGDEEVVEALNAIGKKVFVDYYYIFKKDDSPEEQLSTEYTLNSRRSRSSKARKLFKENKNIEALKLIIESERLDDDTRQIALKILEEESADHELFSQSKNTFSQKMKIGKLARTTIVSMIEEKRIGPDEIKRLLSGEYSKSTFNMSYPILKLADEKIPLADQRTDSNGYSRYYSTSVRYYGKTYLICSQWVERLHREKLEKWIESKSRQ